MPIAGKTIAVTRPSGQEETLVAKLKEAGAVPLVCPLITILPCYAQEELWNLLSNLKDYDWIIFTSANGVNLTLRFAEENHLMESFKDARIACIGKVTEEALSQWKLQAALVPETFQAEDLLEAIKKEPVEGKKFLLLRAKQAREVLHKTLAELGGKVTELAIYDTVPNRDGMDRLSVALRENKVECITFTSPSTVYSFKALAQNFDPGKIKKLIIASIGPVTSETLKKEGFPPAIEAKTFTSEGLFEAVNDYFAKI